MLTYIYESFSDWDYRHVASALTCSYFLYYFYRVVHRPKLIAGEGKYKQALEENLDTLREHFWPTFWAFTRHHQTICRVLFKSKPIVPYIRESLFTKDNGEISLDWVYNNDDNTKFPDEATRPTVLVLPGITGCYDASYVRHVILEAQDLGYRAVVFNNRGLGRTELKTPRTFCACNVEDLETVLSHVNKEFPRSPLYVFAVSLGGVILTNYLSRVASNENETVNIMAALVVSTPWCSFETTNSLEQPVNWLLYNRFIVNRMKRLVQKLVLTNYLASVGRPPTKICAAFVVSVAWDSFKSTASLETPVNWFIYNRYLANGLKNIIKKNMKVFEKNEEINLDHVLKSSSIREFDERFTSKSFGFQTCKDYYTESSLVLKPLENIRVPMLFLNAMDDPFAPFDSIPVEIIKKNPNMALILTDYGGHIGFIEGLTVRGRSLVERLFSQYFAHITESLKKES